MAPCRRLCPENLFDPAANSHGVPLKPDGPCIGRDADSTNRSSPASGPPLNGHILHDDNRRMPLRGYVCDPLGITLARLS